MEKNYNLLFGKISQWIDDIELFDTFIEFNELEGYSYFLDEAQLVEDAITDLHIDEEFEDDNDFQDFFDLAMIDEDINSSLLALKDIIIDEVNMLNEEFQEQLDEELENYTKEMNSHYRSIKL
jgi:hypothetical protein